MYPQFLISLKIIDFKSLNKCAEHYFLDMKNIIKNIKGKPFNKW